MLRPYGVDPTERIRRQHRRPRIFLRIRDAKSRGSRPSNPSAEFDTARSCGRESGLRRSGATKWPLRTGLARSFGACDEASASTVSSEVYACCRRVVRALPTFCPPRLACDKALPGGVLGANALHRLVIDQKLVEPATGIKGCQTMPKGCASLRSSGRCQRSASVQRPLWSQLHPCGCMQHWADGSFS